MRIFGYVLLIVAIVFELLLVLVQLGGDQVSPTGFGVGAMLILTGWRLRTYGKGIAQRRQPLVPGTVAKPGPLPELESPTIELPFTSAVSALIARQIAHSGRIMATLILGGIFFFSLLGAGIGLAVASPLELLAGGGLVGLVCGLVVSAIWKLAGERPARRDLRESTYLRTSGPVQLVPLFGGYLLRLADRSFMPNGRPMALASALRHLTWATVDYSKHSHLIFEVRDHSGHSVYRCAGYELLRG